jgi:hypothetical protein
MSAPKTNMRSSRRHRRRRTVRSGGDGKTQRDDVERSGRATLHHAKPRRAIPSAKRHHSLRHYARPRRATLCRAIHRRRLAPAPALQSMQRRLRSSLRDKPISLYSSRCSQRQRRSQAMRYVPWCLFHSRRIKCLGRPNRLTPTHLPAVECERPAFKAAQEFFAPLRALNATALNSRRGAWRSRCRSTYCRRRSNVRSRLSPAGAHSRSRSGRCDTPSRRWRRSPPPRRKSGS